MIKNAILATAVIVIGTISGELIWGYDVKKRPRIYKIDGVEKIDRCNKISDTQIKGFRYYGMNKDNEEVFISLDKHYYIIVHRGSLYKLKLDNGKTLDDYRIFGGKIVNTPESVEERYIVRVNKQDYNVFNTKGKHITDWVQYILCDSRDTDEAYTIGKTSSLAVLTKPFSSKKVKKILESIHKTSNVN